LQMLSQSRVWLHFQALFFGYHLWHNLNAVGCFLSKKIKFLWIKFLLDQRVVK